jgi:hypothetical protein
MRVAILTVLLTASPALATSYVMPKRHDVYSRNRAYVLDVNPETEVHTVYDARDRTKPLWSFSKPVWHYPFLLSDDGAVAVTVAWKHVQAEDIKESGGVRFWNKDGQFRQYPLADLCPDPPRTQDVGVGPIGDFWRTWYTEVEDRGDGFSLFTTRGVEYRFRYADGELVRARTFGWGAWERWALIVGGLALLATVVALGRRNTRRRTRAAPDPPV